MRGSCGNLPELEKQDLMSTDKLKHSLIADQMFFTFPGCSNPLATQVCLFQHVLQLENQLKGKVQKRKNWKDISGLATSNELNPGNENKNVKTAYTECKTKMMNGDI